MARNNMNTTTQFFLNPLVHLLNAYRAAIMQRELPNFHWLGIVFIVSVLVLFLGLRFFNNMRFQFVEEL